jgi:hypothetical protein
VDDDCDGDVDDGVAGCCVPDATRSCGVDAGECRAGTETCGAGGAWGACLLDGVPVVLPGETAETCDEKDDDCDGITDEPGATGCADRFRDADEDAYGAGASECLCVPTGAFTATVDGDCDDADAGVNPVAAEVCDGRDDDCDGQTDEGFDLGASCTAGVGACTATGALVCDGQGAVACGATPSSPTPEACNGVDDDCDAATDEAGATDCTSFYRDPDSDGYGAGDPQCLCATSGDYTVTTAGDCAAAVASIHPGATERCNGLDDDCDGATDEAFTVGATCTAGIGECTRVGQTICKADLTGTVCDAVAGAPLAEICNGKDDDCDGATDEGFTVGTTCTAGIGECTRVGQTICKVDASGTVCDAVAGTPLTEICNGKDDDCDAATDEAGATGCTSFYRDQDADGYGAGALQCLCARSGDYTATTAGDCNDTVASVRPGATEQCNGVDDDCDGATDESAPQVLCANQRGVCAGSRVSCSGGSYPPCGATEYGGSYQPAELSCDLLDNDCDGTTDEGCP